MQNMFEIKLINASKSTLPLSVSDSSGKCISVQVFRSKVLIGKCRNSKFCLLRRKFYTKSYSCRNSLLTQICSTREQRWTYFFKTSLALSLLPNKNIKLIHKRKMNVNWVCLCLSRCHWIIWPMNLSNNYYNNLLILT
jgi:hypothetical protein